VHGLDRQDAFSHVKLGDVLRERVIFDQPVGSVWLSWVGSMSARMSDDLHGHQVSTRQELHDQVEVVGILERVVQLHDPRRVGFCQDVSLGSDMSQLHGSATTSVSRSRSSTTRRAAIAHLILFEHFVLHQRLHGVDLASVSLLAQSDLSS